MPAYNPLGREADSLYYQVGGIYVPKNIKLTESQARTLQVRDMHWISRPADLRQWVEVQLQQSRRRYFIYQEMYRRDTWIRATVDYIVRRVIRDENRLVDNTDPLNPDITDLQEFLDTCYENGDFHDVYEHIVRSLLLHAQAYVEIERDGNGKPVALWPMDARITFPITDFHGTIIYHVQVYDTEVVWYTPDQVLYFPVGNNGSDPIGVSTMETLYESVAMELQANRYNAALFENNLNIGAVFSMQGVDPDTIEENRQYLLDNYSGPQNAYSPLLLSGDAKMLRDGAQALKDINFEILIKMARQRVAAVFGVPESLIGIPNSVNRSEGEVHERDTYVNTIRPLRRFINRRFTAQFIRRVWGSKDITLAEPLNSMLPTKGELEAVAKAAEVGMMYNDILDMMGLPRVPNGDYFVMMVPSKGGYVRLDQTMPGLGDPHFDFVAYQLEHDAETSAKTNMAMQGVQAPASGQPYIPPRSQDQIQKESIAARIVDVSRSMLAFTENVIDLADTSIQGNEWVYRDEAPGQWVERRMRFEPADSTPSDTDGEVSRRMPLRPGVRGSSTVYITSGGKPRYGTPPKGQQAPATTKSGDPNNNTLTNPKDPNAPKRLTDQERLQVAAARSQVELSFRTAQDENWTNEQFMSHLEEQGWKQPDDTSEQFINARDARAEARRLGEAHPDRTYVLLGKDGYYFLMENDLSAFEAGPGTIKEGQPAKPPKAAPPPAKVRPERLQAVQRSMTAPDGSITEWLEAIRLAAGGK